MAMEVQVFENKHMMAFIELREIEQTVKAAEARKAAIRDTLAKGMEENGIKSIDNEYVTITFIEPTPGKPKLDDKTWRAEDPEGYNKVFKKYNKMSGKKKGYVRVTVKETD